MGKVAFNQSGYDGCSMSVNARIAYASGEMPKSRWTKTKMVAALEEKCEELGLRWDPAIGRMRKDEIFGRLFEWKSWHHTGKYANPTDFFGVDEESLARYIGGGEAMPKW